MSLNDLYLNQAVEIVKSNREIMKMWIVPLIITLIGALIGAWLGARFAIINERKKDQQYAYENYKKNMVSLLHETGSNLTTIRRLQKDIKPTIYVISPLSTNATDYFLIQQESYKLTDGTFIYFLTAMRKTIQILNTTNEIMLDEFKKNGLLSDINIDTIRKKAIIAEAFITIVQKKIDKQAKMHNIRYEYTGEKESLQEEIKQVDSIIEQLQQQ